MDDASPERPKRRNARVFLWLYDAPIWRDWLAWLYVLAVALLVITPDLQAHAKYHLLRSHWDFRIVIELVIILWIILGLIPGALRLLLRKLVSYVRGRAQARRVPTDVQLPPAPLLSPQPQAFQGPTPVWYSDPHAGEDVRQNSPPRVEVEARPRIQPRRAKVVGGIALALVVALGYVVTARAAHLPPFANHVLVPDAGQLRGALLSTDQVNADLGSGWNLHSSSSASSSSASSGATQSARCSSIEPQGYSSSAEADYWAGQAENSVWTVLIAYRSEAAANSSILAWQQWIWCGESAAWHAVRLQSYCGASSPALGSMGTASDSAGNIVHEYLAVWTCKNIVCVTNLGVVSGDSLDSASYLSTITETSSADLQQVIFKG